MNTIKAERVQLVKYLLVLVLSVAGFFFSTSLLVKVILAVMVAGSAMAVASVAGRLLDLGRGSLYRASVGTPVFRRGSGVGLVFRILSRRGLPRLRNLPSGPVASSMRLGAITLILFMEGIRFNILGFGVSG
jgi:hypothetical protein